MYTNFIDFSKALDNLRQYSLINKLIEIGVPGDLTKLIECYLYYQSARVKWKHTYGEYKPIKLGVRQGIYCPRSPLNCILILLLIIIKTGPWM